MAWVQFLVWECLHAAGTAKKKRKQKTKPLEVITEQLSLKSKISFLLLMHEDSMTASK